MKRSHTPLSRLFLVVLALMTAAPLAAQKSDSLEIAENAIFIYRNDKQFNAFFDSDVDSMGYSCIDTLGVEHDHYVSQMVYTLDSVYCIPLSVIDSINFFQPEVTYRKGSHKLTAQLQPYVLYVDSVTLILSPSTPEELLPQEGEVLFAEDRTGPFEDGFVGRVKSLEKSSGRIVYHCDYHGVTFDDIYTCLIGNVRSEEYNANDDSTKIKVMRRTLSRREMLMRPDSIQAIDEDLSLSLAKIRRRSKSGFSFPNGWKTLERKENNFETTFKGIKGYIKGETTLAYYVGATFGDDPKVVINAGFGAKIEQEAGLELSTGGYVYLLDPNNKGDILSPGGRIIIPIGWGLQISIVPLRLFVKAYAKLYAKVNFEAGFYVKTAFSLSEDYDLSAITKTKRSATAKAVGGFDGNIVAGIDPKISFNWLSDNLLAISTDVEIGLNLATNIIYNFGSIEWDKTYSSLMGQSSEYFNKEGFDGDWYTAMLDSKWSLSLYFNLSGSATLLTKTKSLRDWGLEVEKSIYLTGNYYLPTFEKTKLHPTAKADLYATRSGTIFPTSGVALYENEKEGFTLSDPVDISQINTSGPKTINIKKYTIPGRWYKGCPYLIDRWFGFKLKLEKYMSDPVQMNPPEVTTNVVNKVTAHSAKLSGAAEISPMLHDDEWEIGYVYWKVATNDRKVRMLTIKNINTDGSKAFYEISQKSLEPKTHYRYATVLKYHHPDATFEDTDSKEFTTKDIIVREDSCGTELRGLIWNCHNLGADYEYEYGDYYAWGELEPKDSYTEENYADSTYSKMPSQISGNTDYDAAAKKNEEWMAPAHHGRV